ncbi:hypothetical protein SLEP1_g53327 [Rubroshorea leprosula]|uniref:Uncharacterized protein n=1 Tax=Rubroshorea leprosula TaxID=152421 RepID=A0AAV5M997_9ROSI|nr:hypothetical protein SLEP1_g53327 [Rubroshorea leprosula]
MFHKYSYYFLYYFLGPSTETDFRVFTLKVYFKVKPVEANKPQTGPAANGAAASCSTTSTSSSTRVPSTTRVPTKHKRQLLALDRHLLLWETVLGLCLLVAPHRIHPAAQWQIWLLGFQQFLLKVFQVNRCHPLHLPTWSSR